MSSFIHFGVPVVAVSVLAWFGAACAQTAAPGDSPVAAGGKMRVYFGTYTGGQSKGIYVCDFAADTGKLSEPRLAGEVTNPSFLALHPSGRFLYAASEVFGRPGAGAKGASVAAFAIDPATGALALLNQQPPGAGGVGSCHVSVDPTGSCVLVANYGSGTAAALPIDKDGKLGQAASTVKHEGSGPNQKRQEAPHAHSINVEPAGRFAFVCDLGIDKVMIYRLDAQKAGLTPHDPPFASVAPGAGPRHLAFHPNGKFVFVINELLNTITVFSYDAAAGQLAEVQTVGTLPGDFTGASTTAEVVVHPSGRFVYGSNRGHDSIAAFACDPVTGRLTPLGHTPSGGKGPRNFAIDPTGRWLLAAHQSTHNVVVFRLDPAAGALTPTGQSISVGSPVCVKFQLVGP